MTRRRVSNPLALAVLACLDERPMHPYEMASTMRERGQHESIKLNYGSLYSVVEALQRHGLIRPQETARAGKRPERTVYETTEAGQLELTDWLGELLGTPAKEYSQFEAGLCLAGALPPAEVLRLLEQRRQRLEIAIRTQRSILAYVGQQQQVPRVFLIEAEYRLMLCEAELDWVAKLVGEITEGSLDGLALWRGFHASRHPDEAADAREAAADAEAVDAGAIGTVRPRREAVPDPLT